MKLSSGDKNPATFIIFLFIFSAAICLYYGRTGFMPLDHSIIFDGGWRVISGQMPFRDFNTPNGIVPIFMQAVFFRLLGISWFNYCLHAALLNGLFCIFVFLLLRFLSAPRPLAFFYAFASSFIFYPPIGVPFMDQHAFFFILCAVLLPVAASESSNRLISGLCYFFTPLAFAAAYFSKQIPSIFAAPVILSVVLLSARGKCFLRVLYIFSAGAILTTALFFLLFKHLHIDVAQLKLYFIDLPSQIGLLRFKTLISKNNYWHVVKALFYPDAVLGAITELRSFGLIYFSFVSVSVAQAFCFFSRKGRWQPKGESRRNFGEISLSLSLILTCNLFIMFSLNQAENGIPFLFLSAGIMHNVLIRVLKTIPIPRINKMLLPITSAVFIFTVILDLCTFNYKINDTRIINDLMCVRSGAASPCLVSELQFMNFCVPDAFYRFSNEELRYAVDLLRREKENFFLFGDTSILYALARKPSVNPSLWFHGGLTIPRKHSRDFNLYEKRLMDNLTKYRVKYIVVEGEGATLTGVKLDDFQALSSMVKTRGVIYKNSGWFKIIELNI